MNDVRQSVESKHQELAELLRRMADHADEIYVRFNDGVGWDNVPLAALPIESRVVFTIRFLERHYPQTAIVAYRDEHPGASIQVSNWGGS